MGYIYSSPHGYYQLTLQLRQCNKMLTLGIVFFLVANGLLMVSWWCPRSEGCAPIPSSVANMLQESFVAISSHMLCEHTIHRLSINLAALVQRQRILWCLGASADVAPRLAWRVRAFLRMVRWDKIMSKL